VNEDETFSGMIKFLWRRLHPSTRSTLLMVRPLFVLLGLMIVIASLIAAFEAREALAQILWGTASLGFMFLTCLFIFIAEDLATLEEESVKPTQTLHRCEYCDKQFPADVFDSDMVYQDQRLPEASGASNPCGSLPKGNFIMIRHLEVHYVPPPKSEDGSYVMEKGFDGAFCSFACLEKMIREKWSVRPEAQ